MKPPLLRFAACALALGAAFASPAPAQGVGSKIPEIELEGFSQTKAQTFDDYLGRAVLFEFFAYW
jgi:hypothetical protein